MSADLLAAYDGQLRGVAEVRGAPAWDRSGPLWRATYGDAGQVSYEPLRAPDVARLPELVAETVAHYAADPAVRSFEWKARGHDDLPGLHDLLTGAGFVAEEPETVMVGEASSLAVEVRLAEGLSVRRIDDLGDRAALLAVATDLQREVFGAVSGSLQERVDGSAGLAEVWVAEAEGRMVSVGRLEVVPDSDFAGLWGGATLPAWRGRGIYRAMTAARAASAIRRGMRYLHSDCTAMSRPILERSGLRPITTTTPYVWTRPAA